VVEPVVEEDADIVEQVLEQMDHLVLEHLQEQEELEELESRGFGK
jgi:hypothetical protein